MRISKRSQRTLRADISIIIRLNDARDIDKFKEPTALST